MSENYVIFLGLIRKRKLGFVHAYTKIPRQLGTYIFYRIPERGMTCLSDKSDIFCFWRFWSRNYCISKEIPSIRKNSVYKEKRNRFYHSATSCRALEFCKKMYVPNCRSIFVYAWTNPTFGFGLNPESYIFFRQKSFY